MKASFKHKKLFSLGLLIVVALANLSAFSLTSFNKLNSLNDNEEDYTQFDSLSSQDIYEEHFTEEWLENPTFDEPINPWYNITEGDTSDLNATTSQNQANYQVLGEERTYSMISDPPIISKWVQTTNPNFPYLPDTYTINGEGFYVSHYWDEGADQSTSVHWERNISLPVNFSDYIITSASIQARCNATVTTPSSQPYSDGVDTPADTADPWFQVATGDYIRFYILISDPNKENIYEIAYNQTYDLGQDSPAISTMANTFMKSVPEETLIFYLTSVLSADFQNFTITVGIRIWCEDNFPQDSDSFDDILINYVNLTFTYVKKINQITSLSWNQIGNTITGNNIDITNAKLNFKYKLSHNWSNYSPNSEIRIKIINTLHSETIKLSSATTEFQEANSEGIDVTGLIQKDVNITLSIQLFIADDFGLDKIVTLSIDNASLQISYVITNNEETTQLSLFLNGQNKTLSGLIQISIGEFVNISISYGNSSGGFISNASVILYGYGIPTNLTEDLPHDDYFIVLNTSTLDLGENYFTLQASKFTYETQTVPVTIDVKKRASYINNIYLNNTLTNSIDILWNESLDISVSYNDTLSGNFISGATVELLGTTFTKQFVEAGDEYTLTINTTQLEYGSNYLTISALEEDHILNSSYIIITVNIRSASLKILIDGEDDLTFEYFNASIGHILNFTVFHKDITSDINIQSSVIKLHKDTLLLGTFSKHSVFNQYNLSILTDDIGSGINILTITAEKDNYTTISKEINIIIGDRASELEVYLNGTLTENNGNFTLQIGEALNVSAFFKDSFDLSHLTGATLRILGYGNFSEDVLNDLYYIIINAEDLSQGYTFLTIIAQIENYESQTLDLIIEVTERDTQYQIFFDGIDKTLDRYFELPIGKNLNVTVKYIDIKMGVFIDGAAVSFQGDISYELQENILFHQYTYLVNSTELDIGVSLLSLLIHRDNYKPQNPDLTIVVKRINSTITTEAGENLFDVIPGKDFLLKIKLINEDFGGLIFNATVRYSWEYGQGLLEDTNHDGIYEVELERVPSGTFTIVITAFAGDDHDFARYEVTLSAVDPNAGGSNFLIPFILVLSAVFLLTASFALYEKKLKVPKPIRKLRKYRKTLKKEKGVENIPIISRETAIKDQHKKDLSIMAKFPKLKTEGAEESSLLDDQANIIEK